VRRITGEVRDRAPLVVDDMISTGGMSEAAIGAVREAGCKPDAVVVATHGLFVGPAVERLRPLDRGVCSWPTRSRCPRTFRCRSKS
jgi:ribose-phosphate pyrophosphokinase